MGTCFYSEGDMGKRLMLVTCFLSDQHYKRLYDKLTRHRPGPGPGPLPGPGAVLDTLLAA